MSELTDDIKKLVLLILVAITIIRIVFYKETSFNVLKITCSFFLMFVLPGFMFMYIWRKQLDFMERFIISVPISAVIVSLTYYYISLL